ncbi:MAG: hypothetical protein QM764_00185 [Chitinophagaceae bacterium]
MLVIILFNGAGQRYRKGKTAPLSFYLFDVFIFIIWFLVINGIYIGLALLP